MGFAEELWYLCDQCSKKWKKNCFYVNIKIADNDTAVLTFVSIGPYISIMADPIKNDLQKLFTLPIIRIDESRAEGISGIKMCGSAILVDSGTCGLFLLSTVHVFDNLNSPYYTVIDNKLVAITGESFWDNPDQRNILDIDYSICMIKISSDLADLLAMNFLVFPYKAYPDNEGVNWEQDIFIQGNPGTIKRNRASDVDIHFSAFRYHTEAVDESVYHQYRLDSRKFLILNYHRFSASIHDDIIENPNPLDLCGSGIWTRSLKGGLSLLGIVSNSADNYLIGTSIRLYFNYITDFLNYMNIYDKGYECFN